MAGYGFARDVANSRIAIEVAGTEVLRITATNISFPVSTVTYSGRVDVEQITSHSQAVTGANGTSGTILLDNVDLAGATEAIFTVACDEVAANDTVLLCVGDYVDAAAAPVVSIEDVGTGTFSVLLSNPSGVTSFNACKLNFAIIKSVA